MSFTTPPTPHRLCQMVPFGGNTRVAHRAKMVKKKISRAHHAAEEFHQDPKRPKSTISAKHDRDRRSDEISAFNRKCTKMEIKAKDGEMRKEGALNAIAGATFPPFILKLDRIANEGYTGAELRTIRAENGCGNPMVREVAAIRNGVDQKIAARRNKATLG